MKTWCTYLDQGVDVAPAHAEGREERLRTGSRWVHLRLPHLRLCRVL